MHKQYGGGPKNIAQVTRPYSLQWVESVHETNLLEVSCWLPVIAVARIVGYVCIVATSQKKTSCYLVTLQR